MPSIQIKDVPEGTHKVLRVRAAAAHQSLQEYLRSKLIEEAAQPTLQELFAQVEPAAAGERTPTIGEVTAALRAEREGR